MSRKMLYLKILLLVEIISGIRSLDEAIDAKCNFTNACYISIVIQCFNSNLLNLKQIYFCALTHIL